uniref:PH domain-containing protein n=1 Tax=Macrostomum lignano TaxID=282301 RepID=A0A1I8GY40_9PLAT
VKTNLPDHQVKQLPVHTLILTDLSLPMCIGARSLQTPTSLDASDLDSYVEGPVIVAGLAVQLATWLLSAPHQAANLTEETLIDRFIIHRMLNVSMAKKKCNLIVFNYSGQQYAMSYKLSESSAPSVNWWLLLAPQQQPLMPAGNSLRQCGTVCGDGHASLWRSASALDLLKSAIGFPADNSTAATASFLAGKRPLRSARVLKRGRRLRGIWRRKLLLVTEDCLGYCSEDRRALSVSGVSVPLHRLAAAYLVPKERTDELRITSACLETNLAFKFATPDEACSWLALLNDLIMRQSKT